MARLPHPSQMKHVLPLVLAVFATTFGTAVARAEGGQRTASAHVHGTGNLNIVVDKDKLLIELAVPGANVIGFEHAAKSDGERAVLSAAKTKLRDTVQLFTFTDAAKCTPRFSDVEYRSQEYRSHDTKNELGKDARKDKTHKSAEQHAEFHAVYELACESLPDLKSISTHYFDLFPGGKALTVRVVGELVQDKLVITGKDPVIRF